MIIKVADNIVSPLGLTSEDNFRSVVEGFSQLKLHDGVFGIPEPFCASLLNRTEIEGIFNKECGDSALYSFFEQLCIISARRAVADCSLDTSRDDLIFVLSTTKGNVDKLDNDLYDKNAYLASSARKISGYFQNPNTPIVVSNACVSGVCAQIAAIRALLGGKYEYAVVIGCDVLSRFIVSGFQSFKALSPEPCMPYNKQRNGLNLGEAAGTMILKSVSDAADGAWRYVASSVHNDANHISGPSRTGEGSYRVLKDILEVVDSSELAFVNAHGTATAYNDEMESIALHRAGLDDVPVNGLKGYYGHTLGAAGVIETILSMKAVDKGLILPTRGYSESGTTYVLNISDSLRYTQKRSFIKILSGFGGSNAGIAYEKGGVL